jgi:thiamine-monophosphate kinase
LDDAALLSVPVGHELVVTTDAIVAGVHFLPADPARDIARKALRVNLSDLAAKGAKPLAYTLTLALGRDVGDEWVAQFADGLASDQVEFGIALAGGDSVSTAGPIWASITAFGLVKTAGMVRRSGARPGDIVLVTGTIGDAALGLKVAQGGLTVPDHDRTTLVDRYRLPRPRTHLSQAIAAYANAAIDISDGLAADLGHLCRASKVRGRVDVSLLPLSPATRRVIETNPAYQSDILAGGDDYEVLLTASPQSTPALCVAANDLGIDLTKIGFISSDDDADQSESAVFIDASGGEISLSRVGWTHS